MLLMGRGARLAEVLYLDGAVEGQEALAAVAVPWDREVDRLGVGERPVVVALVAAVDHAVQAVHVGREAVLDRRLNVDALARFDLRAAVQIRGGRGEDARAVLISDL